uniref:Putative ribose-5-phosphate isomerase 3ic n=1 Tax=Rhizophora mucronata TaxID=61149 RepID=A0A2P2KE85_RHIMU
MVVIKNNIAHMKLTLRIQYNINLCPAIRFGSLPPLKPTLCNAPVLTRLRARKYEVHQSPIIITPRTSPHNSKAFTLRVLVVIAINFVLGGKHHAGLWRFNFLITIQQHSITTMIINFLVINSHITIR